MPKKALAPVAALVSDRAEKDKASESTIYRECDPAEECLFRGKDEVGREGWFLRLEVTGMYTRRCGPFETREEALDVLEGFVNDVDTAYCDVLNGLYGPQICAVEGVPRLVATAQEG